MKIALLSTSDTDLLSARASGAASALASGLREHPANSATAATVPIVEVRVQPAPTRCSRRALMTVVLLSWG